MSRPHGPELVHAGPGCDPARGAAPPVPLDLALLLAAGYGAVGYAGCQPACYLVPAGDGRVWPGKDEGGGSVSSAGRPDPPPAALGTLSLLGCPPAERLVWEPAVFAPPDGTNPFTPR